MSPKRKTPVTTAMLAKLCGVSQGTVDRALHDRAGIKPATREQILSVAKEYGYRPNIHAQSLVSGKSSVIGIVVFDLYNDYFSEMIMNLENVISQENLHSVIMFSEKNMNREKECIQALYAMGADGLILCPVNGGEAFGRYLNALGIPVVTVGNRVPGIPYVGVDNYRAMYELTKYRIAQGYRKLHYYAPVLSRIGSNIDAQEQRYQGFQAAAKEANVSYDLFTRQPENLSELCHGQDTAVFASTDHYALRLIYAGIPANQLSGFDAINALSRYCIPLVTVGSNFSQTASVIVSMLTGDLPAADRIIPHNILFP